MVMITRSVSGMFRAFDGRGVARGQMDMGTFDANALLGFRNGKLRRGPAVLSTTLGIDWKYFCFSSGIKMH